MGTKDPGEAPVPVTRQGRQRNRYAVPDEGDRLLPGPDQAPDTPIRQNRHNLSEAGPP